MVRYRRRPRRGRGVLAIGIAFVVTFTGTVAAATLAMNDPFAPALVGGGAALLGIALGRWGYRELRTH